MLSTPYHNEFVYNGTAGTNNVYDLTILTEDDKKITVILAELEENIGISITNCYERIATNVYHQYLKEIQINNIIWIEKVTHHKKVDAFFKIDLIFDEQLQYFHSPQWSPCDPKIISSIKKSCAEYPD